MRKFEIEKNSNGDFNVRFDSGEWIEFKLPENDKNNLVEFYCHYKLIKTIDSKIPFELRDEGKDKRCRFCKKTERDVTFSNNAHLIPSLWNRPKITVNFECDSCNEKFSKLESDFGHYFLTDRVLFGQLKKKGRPKYKNATGASMEISRDDKIFNDIQGIDSKLKNELKDKMADNKFISFAAGESDDISINNGVLNFNLLRMPYRPINVFRVLLKIGLSLLPEVDIMNYKSQFKLLNTETGKINFDCDNFDYSELKLYISEIPYYVNFYPYPVVSLYKNIFLHDNYVDSTLVIHLANRIYQIPILSDRNLHLHYKKKQDLKFIKISPFLSPLLSAELINNDKIFGMFLESYFKTVNLCSNKLMRNDRHVFSIKGMVSLV